MQNAALRSRIRRGCDVRGQSFPRSSPEVGGIGQANKLKPTAGGGHWGHARFETRERPRRFTSSFAAEAGNGHIARGSCQMQWIISCNLHIVLSTQTYSFGGLDVWPTWKLRATQRQPYLPPLMLYVVLMFPTRVVRLFSITYVLRNDFFLRFHACRLLAWITFTSS